jgi:hypothetical protein
MYDETTDGVLWRTKHVQQHLGGLLIQHTLGRFA